MTTTENTVAATTVARKYASHLGADNVAMIANLLQGIGEVMGVDSPEYRRRMLDSYAVAGVDVAGARSEYAYLTRR